MTPRELSERNFGHVLRDITEACHEARKVGVQATEVWLGPFDACVLALEMEFQMKEGRLPPGNLSALIDNDMEGAQVMGLRVRLGVRDQVRVGVSWPREEVTCNMSDYEEQEFNFEAAPKSGRLGRYPQDPGVKSRGDTSVEAAVAMRHRAVKLRILVLEALCTKPMTADETAAILFESPLAVRPRFSELLAVGMIVDTGERRKNKRGKSAAVWKLAEPND